MEARDELTLGLFISTTATSGRFPEEGSNAPLVWLAMEDLALSPGGASVPLELSETPAARRRASVEPPYATITAGPAVTVRVLPSRSAGMFGRVLLCAVA